MRADAAQPDSSDLPGAQIALALRLVGGLLNRSDMPASRGALAKRSKPVLPCHSSSATPLATGRAEGAGASLHACSQDTGRGSSAALATLLHGSISGTPQAHTLMTGCVAGGGAPSAGHRGACASGWLITTRRPVRPCCRHVGRHAGARVPCVR